jgi:signal transduction histidine kinase
MRIPRWLTHSVYDPGQVAPPEVPWLRLMGLATLCVFAASGIGSRTHPGHRPVVLALLVVFLVAAVRSVPLRGIDGRPRTRWLVLLSVLGIALTVLQPKAAWVATPYLVGSTSVMRLEFRTSLALFAGDLAGTAIAATAVGHGGAALSIALGAIPFYLFMRLLRRGREEHAITKGLVVELEASRAAEAKAATEAERSRLAREMHDVLAHSLSALSLQLESTRLLAADRGVDAEVVAALERAHGLAAGGLSEARRAIGALRGDELPGPARLPALVEGFRASSGVDCSLSVTGSEQPLAPDARLAVYRTAQEALTNVRRHADCARVEVALEYRPGGTRLRVADHGTAAEPLNGHGGYGRTGMRERAELLGGALTATPTPDGFCVELWLPAS